jgi:hypothetical protein
MNAIDDQHVHAARWGSSFNPSCSFTEVKIDAPFASIGRVGPSSAYGGRFGGGTSGIWSGVNRRST